MITEAQKGDVIKIVGDMLRERFEGLFVFDPILVESDIDHDGDECWEVTIVYEGDIDLLDVKWTSDLIRQLELKLAPRGLDAFDYLGCRFVEKSEWDAFQDGRYFDEDLFESIPSS